MKPSIALSMVFIASMAQPLKARPSSLGTSRSRLPHWRDFIFSPVRSTQASYEDLLDEILAFKRTNDKVRAAGIDRELFANLTAVTDAIRHKILQKDGAIIDLIGPDLETKEAAECKKIYLSWRKMGDELWHSFYLCRVDGMAKFTMHKKKLRETVHIYREFQKFRAMIKKCIRMVEYPLSYGPIVCTLRVGVELLIFLYNNSRDYYTYMDASIDLMKLREEIRSHERSRLGDFYKRAETIVCETQNCLDKLKSR